MWLQEYQRGEERREELKQQIALTATRLLQDPEQHARDLTALVQLARDRDEMVSSACIFSGCSADAARSGSPAFVSLLLLVA